MVSKYFKETEKGTIFSNGEYLQSEMDIDGVIHKVNIINPTEQQMLEAGWQIYVVPEPTNTEKLIAAKAEKLQQIENYDASENVEQFTINGTPMWLNHEVRQQIKTSVEAYMATGATTVTKIFGGVEYTFPCEVWLQMLAALEVYAAEALNVTERHKITVQNMTRRKDVEDYDYTTDYPAKLEFGE